MDEQHPASPEDTITALQAELAAVRAEMQDFAGTVSHDLRAPLRHILSYAQLVQEDAGPQLDAEVQGFLATIVDSARHMGGLLDGLSQLSRAGAQPIHLEAVALQDLVQELCDRLSGQHPGRDLRWDIAADLPVVRSDAQLLRQALEQVLDNAVKFTAPRAPAVIRVDRAPDGADGRVTLRIQDNGVGYNPALQGKLFKVFGRLHSAQQFPGVGMGLALARKLLQRVDAHMAIEGAVDAGCTVRLDLPARG
jgi:light-regulated signal transduction histidine kinase (bacteriophytochrome)